MAEFELNGIKLSVPDGMLNEKLKVKLSDGRYEGREANAASKLVRKGKRVLDLGTGVGYIAAICARQAGPENVVTIEANPDLMPVAQDNLERNGYGKVTVIHGAVVGERPEADVIAFERKNSFWSGRLAGPHPDTDATIMVPTITIQELLKKHRSNIVIMDIEGAEGQLFDQPWPDHVENVLLELHPHRVPGAVIKKIVDCMSAAGLTYDLVTSRGRILGFQKVPEN